ncbi:MAG TPA: histidine phosphatase family protein [Oscillospiraceae bacterium]|nr:histidine phosphatase family protein [Oscillospiraceae bacterium]HPK35753.1 histidine phosphatase family protein [Oscillospiraceae bacterium]HPR75039.1 histidine phosphatase family protein [Oscillospiraceae bacterium]
MICYLVRHGKDDDTIRGGWSESGLTSEGKKQALRLAADISHNKLQYNIKHIYSSDLPRAVQTAEPIAAVLNLPITALKQFREANNGDLAGMDNDIANQKYPGLYWNTLEWEECYPNGESPKEFFERVCEAWRLLTYEICDMKENVLIVTHSGVINIILHQINNTVYTNKGKQIPIRHTALIKLKKEQGIWEICEV